MASNGRESQCRRLAVVFGLALAVIAVAYNWSNPSWWPFIAVDYIAVVLLLYGAWRSPRVLTGGWGFTCAMFYMAFFSSWDQGRAPSLLIGMGAMFGITIVGFALSLPPVPAPEKRRKQPSDDSWSM